MKDQQVRSAVELLDNKIFSLSGRVSKLEDHAQRLLTIVEDQVQKLKEHLEAVKPTCPTCGQKIQDGFKAGQIEQVAAEVRKRK